MCPSQADPAPPSRVSVVSIGEEPGIFTASLLENILVVAWIGVANVESIVRYNAVVTSCRDRYAGGIGAIQLVGAKLALPDHACDKSWLR